MFLKCVCDFTYFIGLDNLLQTLTYCYKPNHIVQSKYFALYFLNIHCIKKCLKWKL